MTVELIIVSVVVLAVVVVVGYLLYTQREAQLRRRLRRAPPTTAVALAPGTTARVTGTVVGGAALPPLGNDGCVAYHALIQKFFRTKAEGTGDGSRWSELGRVQQCASLVLRDASGDVTIQADHHVELLHPPNAVVAQGFLDELDPPVRHWLSQHISEDHGYVRWLHVAVRPGERITAVGRVATGRDGQLALVGSPEEPILLAPASPE